MQYLLYSRLATLCLQALFEVVNVMICIWEIALYKYQSHIQKEVEGFRKKYGTKGKLPSPIILFQDASLAQVLTLKYWATIWSTYALMDDSYADTKSWGFWVDSGNGVTTLFPSSTLQPYDATV